MTDYFTIIRNVVINMIRKQGYPFIPEGCRGVEHKLDRGLHLLF